MSAYEALDELKTLEMQSTPLGLIAASPGGREVIRELKPAYVESCDGGKLLLSFDGKIEAIDLSGATFASTPRWMQITFEDGKFVALSERR